MSNDSNNKKSGKRDVAVRVVSLLAAIASYGLGAPRGPGGLGPL